MRSSVSHRTRLFDRKFEIAIQYAVESLEQRTLLNSYLVTTTNDSGPGSLRAAIIAANANPNPVNGVDMIDFDLQGSGVQTISPTSALPQITDPVEIDGESQPGYSGQPLIDLNGAKAGPSNGLNFVVGGNVVQGLDIDDFYYDGLVIAGPSSSSTAGGNTIQDNYIGTDPTGTIARPNEEGVHLIYSPNDLIQGNLISGNAQSGIFVADKFSTGTTIAENLIGTDITGMKALGNDLDGIALGAPPSPTPSDGYASGIIIGSIDPAMRNVISGNDQSGIWIEGGDSNTVLGNYIGVAVDGSTPLANGTAGDYADPRFGIDGILIDGATNTTIGGTGAHAGNVISGNDQDGIQIIDGATGTQVQGNLIGSDSTGLKAVPNTRDGVAIFDSAANTVGGFVDGARNIISGNDADGVFIGAGALGSGSVANVVLGDYIGLDITGATALGNNQYGVEINGGANNFIGVANAAGRNVISGNLGSGIVIGGGAATTGNQILGNLVGTDTTGTLARANGNDGIDVLNSSLNVIGGTTAAARNIVSGNAQNGIFVSGSNAVQNTIEGNYIGTDLTGALPVANTVNGVFINGLVAGAAANNVVGGATAGAGNVISGNGNDGVQISGGATGNSVQGNLIGTALNGLAALANGRHGVTIFDSNNNTIGGPATASGSTPGNVISGNKGNGVLISGIATGTATGNAVAGNLIGLNITGAAAIPNVQDGVLIDGAAANTVGDPTGSSHNIISGNGSAGLVISDTGATKNLVEANYIGTDVTGANAVPNDLAGLFINNVPENTIGGSVALCNVISGNDGPGLYISGSNASGNIVYSNFIGTSELGTAALPNQGSGVVIDGAVSNLIGNTGTGQGNVISGNTEDGIELTGATAAKNQLLQNDIGTDLTATLKLGNERYGIEADNGANNNVIGGTGKGAGNTVAFNGMPLGPKGYGVVVPYLASDAIRGNSIYSNGGRGIVLVNLASPFGFVVPGSPVVSQVNPSTSTPGDTDMTWTFTSTPNTTFTIDFYTNTAPSPSGFGDGQTYVGTDTYTTNANGTVTFTRTFHSDQKYISTTATDPTGNTSEFSMVDSDGDGLADAWETGGIDYNEDGTPDLYLPGANPLRKDVYVEIDSMTGFEPSQDALNMVINAFANAPVTNPDGSTGISLHLEDDEIMDDQKWIGDLNGNGVIDSYDLDPLNWLAQVKANGINGVGGFGTAQERKDPNTMGAKALTYHYAVFADEIQVQKTNPDGSTYIAYNVSGDSESPGNDIIVSLGAWGEKANEDDYVAGTFMHELGHNLGLDHGGGDGVNFKPNYQSVMNYEFQVPADWMYEDTNHDGIQDGAETDINKNGIFGDTTWSLNYSTTQLNPINENNLSEPAGIGGIAGDWETVGPNGTIILTSGPVDWNGNGTIDAAPITSGVDLNNDGTLSTLIGYNDWANLQYYFLNSQQGAGGASPPDDDDGLSLTQWEAINAEGSGPGVLEVESTVVNVSEGDKEAVITVLRGAGTQGAVTVHYATSDGTATAGSNYVATSGALTFAAGQYINTITIPILDDSRAENTQAFQLTLSAPSGGAMVRVDEGTATVNIKDDDAVNTYVVTNTNDSGPGSLRQAILDANASPGDDLINFNIASAGVQTIELLSALPAITDQVTIDATSQPGFAGTPLIEIDGQSAPGTGITVGAPNSMVLGLLIDGFTNSGITINDVGQTTIKENTISNDGTGILITGSNSQNDQIFGNVITGNSSNGVDITGGASNNAIGGNGVGDGNQISQNAAAGVYVESGTGNAILHNAISDNGGLGIDLAPLGVTPNDPQSNYDQDTGANELQNTPVLILATGGGSHRVLGTLTTAADSTYVVEIFVLAAPDPSGYGEGDQYLLSTTVTTNDSGIAYFDVTLPAGVAGAGTYISATATDASGNTSEFSNAVQVQQDTDGDGISDAMEDAGPNGGDANDDGIPDSQESNVASFPDALNGKYVTIEAPAGETLTDVNPLPYLFPEDGPTNASFSLGLFGFTLNGLAVGGSSEVNILLPAGSNPQSYFGYGAVPWDTEPEWYSWYDDGQTGADINGDEITLHVVDGQMGDNDQIANGSVSVVSGPGLPFHFVVTNTNDSGPGSLRQAIIDSNNQSGPQNYIDFDIDGGGVHTIYPQSPLPAITNWVIIDGTTQPGFAGTPIVVVNGSEAGTADGFDVGSPDVTIRGLVIDDFRSGGGIVVYNAGLYEPSPNDFDFAGNYIGTDVTGMVSAGNYYGIYTGAGDDCLIGGSDPGDGNVISGNISSGIYTISTSSLDIQGNYIGVGADGVTPIANGGDGVTIGLPGGGTQLVTDTTIGGMDPGDGNIIANNLGSGIDDYYDGDNDNAYLSNDIYANAIVGIANEPLGVAAINDIGGSSGLTDDTYGNPQNYPILGSAQSSGGQTTISGYLSSRPDESFIVQFFGNVGVPSNGEVEGAVYLGSTTVETDDNGYVSFTATLDGSVPDHELITASATSVVMNQTSAFSPRLGVGDVLGNVYVVNTTDDTDDGYINPAHMTLRDAILAANNHPGLDTILFDINGGGLATISPKEPLPVITDAVIIDGASQPGFDGTPLIQLSGAKMDPVPDQPDSIHLTGLYVLGDGSTIEGLDINGFYEFTQQTSNSAYWGGEPLIVRGNNNTIQGDFIGTDPTGTKSLQNLDGVSVDGTGNLIGGTTPAQRNIISGNYNYGLTVTGDGPALGSATGPANVIEGNFIGTDVTGTKALANGIGTAFNSFGLTLRGANILGGAAPGAGNIISGNNGVAVMISSGEGSIIQGNFIGTDVTGTKKLGNSGYGIEVYDNDFDPTSGVTIGGTLLGEGNIVSNNNQGIGLFGSLNVVQGNLIGTDITGTLGFGNFDNGIILGDDSNTIGGPEAGAGNLISGNGEMGILLDVFGQSSGTVIQGNRIGTQADGVSPLGNAYDGIGIASNISFGSGGTGPSGDLIGGTDSGDGNVIAFNGNDGVEIVAGQDIGVLSNSIYSNAFLGIDLGGNGVTANDPGDADSGPNNLQNYPVITSVATDGSHTTVTGTLNSTPNTAFTLQFFSNAAADSSGYGQGQTLLGTRLVITDSTGNAEFTVTFPAAVTVGQFISATATDRLNNTSEFCADLAVTSGTVAPNQPPTANAGGPYTINEGSGVTLDGSLSADPDGDPLTYSWDINGDGVFGDATGVSPSLSWAQLEALGIVNGPSTFNVRVQVGDGQGHTVTSEATTLTVLNVPPTAIVGPDQYVTEGDTVTLVGSFTDPGNNDTQTFDWHVTSSNGQVIPDSTGETFTFVVDDNGTYTATFTVTDSDGGVGSATTYVYAANADPVVSIGGIPGNPAIGTQINLTSIVTDSPADTVAGFTYLWDIELEDNYSFFISAQTPDVSFTPQLAGIYDIYLSVTDKDYGSGYANASVTVPEQSGGTPVVTLGPGATINEGDQYASTGSFTDPNAGESWTAIVDYGDGSGDQPLALNSDQTFDLAHVYTTPGAYEVNVTVTDSDGFSGSQTTQVAVNNVPPSISLPDPSPISLGAPLTFAGSFTDPGDDTWTATVDYGDNTGTQPLTLAPDNTFTLDHLYSSTGDFTITVVVSDNYGGSDTVTRTAVVQAQQQQPTSLVADPASAVYGGDTALSATLSASGDPLAGQTIVFQINGTTVGSAVTDASGVATLPNLSIGSLGAGVATLSVSFAGDDSDASATGASTLTVDKATLTVTANNASRVYGQDDPSFTGSIVGIQNGDDITAVFSTDATDTSAVGNYPITVDLLDPDGRLDNYNMTTIDGTLTVLPTTLAAVGVNITGSEGTPFSGVVATFTTNNPIATASDFIATITWGDGQVSSGTVMAASGGGFEVVGTNTYADNGDYPVTVNIQDVPGQGSASAQAQASIANVPPTVFLAAPSPVSVGSTFTLSGSFSDPGADTWTGTVDYGDGNGAQPLSLAADKSFSLSHVFNAAGVYTVTVTITDKDGGVGTASQQVTVEPAAPQVQGFMVNDGNVQRSMVNSLTVTFTQPVTLDPSAITLTMRGGGAVAFNLTSSVDDRTFVLTFAGPNIIGGSLADGVYDLTIHASLVHDAFNQTLVGGDQTFTFYRLFGDVNGDGQVDATDLLLIERSINAKSTSPNYLWYVDYFGEGQDDLADYAQARARLFERMSY